MSRADLRRAERARGKLAATVRTLLAEARAHAEHFACSRGERDAQLALLTEQQRIHLAARVRRATRTIGAWRVRCSVATFSDALELWHLSASMEVPTAVPTAEDATLITEVAVAAGAPAAATHSTLLVRHWIWTVDVEATKS